MGDDRQKILSRRSKHEYRDRMKSILFMSSLVSPPLRSGFCTGTRVAQRASATRRNWGARGLEASICLAARADGADLDYSLYDIHIEQNPPGADPGSA